VDRSLDIAIVGAGVAGLASAIALARHGHRLTVYERFETARPLGAGLMLQPTGLVALERLGLRVAIEALGHRIERLHGLTAGGATIFDLAYADLDAGLHACAVHRAALHRVLWDGFARSGAALETGHAIASVEPVAGQRARLIDAGGRTLPVHDLIIDASGANSPLRAWVCARPTRRFTYGAVWASVPDHGLAPHMLAQRYVAARIMIGYLPVGRIDADGPACAAFFWSLKPGDHEAWRANFAVWRTQVVALWPALAPIVEGLRSPDDFTLASYTHFSANCLSRANVVLVGDAAHATSPQLGQGANQGLIDAVVLADALAGSDDLSKAFARYQKARRAHVGFYQLASAAMTPFFQSDSCTLALLRDLTFNRLKSVPYLRREMVRTLAGLKTGPFTWRTPDGIVNGLVDQAVTRRAVPTDEIA
jgi:2-polyprenyl-6-methoxyphenol hydroxylase-like FAD-dependent oxidoreductase